MWYLVLTCVISFLVIWLTYLTYRWSNPRCNGTLPPGAMGFPLIGETIQFMITPGNSLDILPFLKKRIHRYGKLFKTSLLGKKIVVSTDPEINHYILQQEGELVQMWYLDSFDVIFKEDDMAKDTGHIHKYIKGLVLGHFGPEGLKDQMLPKLEETVCKALHCWALRPLVDVKQAVLSMLSNLVLMEMLSYDPEKSSMDMSKLFANFLDGLISVPLNIPGTAFHRCLKTQKQMLNLMKEAINERMCSNVNQPCREDLLDRIIYSSQSNDLALTVDGIANTMFGLLVASSESLPTVLTLAIKLLTDHPLVLKELKEEHEAIVKNRQDCNSGVTWLEYKSMNFTSRVINEVLRMVVSPGQFRKALKDVNINGYTIPADWCIIVQHSAVNRDPDTFPDPHVFNPWRWKRETKVSAKCFAPFGGGIRSCPGSEFSKLLIAIFLHVFITKYRWTVIKGGDVRLKRAIISFGDGFHIKVWEKND